MNDLDKIFFNASNQMNNIFAQANAQNQAAIAEAQKLQDEALKQMHHQIIVDRIETFLTTLILVIIASKLWDWFHNTQRDLKTISDVARQMSEKQASHHATSDEHTLQNNPAATPHSQQRLNHTGQQPRATTPNAPADSSDVEDLDLPYKPKS